jgi:hypothetical protein
MDRLLFGCVVITVIQSRVVACFEKDITLTRTKMTFGARILCHLYATVISQNSYMQCSNPYRVLS